MSLVFPGISQDLVLPWERETKGPKVATSSLSPSVHHCWQTHTWLSHPFTFIRFFLNLLGFLTFLFWLNNVWINRYIHKGTDRDLKILWADFLCWWSIEYTWCILCVHWLFYLFHTCTHFYWSPSCLLQCQDIMKNIPLTKVSFDTSYSLYIFSPCPPSHPLQVCACCFLMKFQMQTTQS